VRALQERKRGGYMAKSYAKSQKAYEDDSVFDDSKILEAMKKRQKGQRKPTSVALDESTIKDLKKIAAKLEIPYQVVMRMFILDGIRRFKTSP
tara:strand:+ start:8538 stop:8816 length:279 start_codon:yes stop_codon:yes gene_type:complete